MALTGCTAHDTTTSTAVSSTYNAGGANSAGKASTVLSGLSVKGRAPLTGYSRVADFGKAWTDDTTDLWGHNGCDTRDDILKRDLRGIVWKNSTHCAVASGTLQDPYTGRTIHFVRGTGTSTTVQIDHQVALADAWQTGAQSWPQTKRVQFANDPLNLAAVDGPTNEQKGDADAASWLPTNKSARCTYVANQIAVKAKYGLWMTSAEKAAAGRVLSTCPGQQISVEPGGYHL